jgi:hypothetical protein
VQVRSEAVRVLKVVKVSQESLSCICQVVNFAALVQAVLEHDLCSLPLLMLQVLCFITSLLCCLELSLEVVHNLLLISLLIISLSPVLSKPLKLRFLNLDLNFVTGLSYLYLFDVFLLINSHLFLSNDLLFLDLCLEKSLLLFVSDSLNSEFFSFFLDNSR